MSYTFSKPLGKLLSLDLSYAFSSRIMQCAFVFAIKNKMIYFKLSIVDNIQNLIYFQLSIVDNILFKLISLPLSQQIQLDSYLINFHKFFRFIFTPLSTNDLFALMKSF